MNWLTLTSVLIGALIGAGSSIGATMLSNRHARRLATEERAERYRLAQRAEVVAASTQLSEASFVLRSGLDSVDFERTEDGYRRLTEALSVAAIFAPPAVLTLADRLCGQAAEVLVFLDAMRRTEASYDATSQTDTEVARLDRLDRLSDQRQAACARAAETHDELIATLRAELADFSRTDAV